MKDRISTALLSAAISVVAMSGAAMAQPTEAWDRNGDAGIDRDEFSAGLNDAGLFDTWDTDDDDTLSAVELESGLYNAWDLDGDGTLDIAEWDTAVDAWFGEDDVNLSEAAWDGDGDGTISQIEFVDALRRTEFYARFGVDADEDFAIDRDAFTDGLFETADLDGDSLIGSEEDGLLVEFGEWLLGDEGIDPIVDPNLGADINEPPLIERGEAFTQLPIPCGDDGASGEGTEQQFCEPIAARFCEALGYGPPIDYVAAEAQLYVVRCEDEI